MYRTDFLTERRHPVAAPGQDLMRIGLVADIPNQAVFRGVEYGMQRDRQFDGAQIRRKVATGLRHRLQ